MKTDTGNGLPSSRIFLWGLMGSGKSTLGRYLAQRLGLPFVDLDAATTALAGAPIPELFASEGEARFRELERQALLTEIETKDAGVFACGGGLPCFFDNADLMNREGTTLWLDVPVSELARRLASSPVQRPLLLDPTGKLLSPNALHERLLDLYDTRLPWYRTAQLWLRGGNNRAPDAERALRDYANALRSISP